MAIQWRIVALRVALVVLAIAAVLTPTFNMVSTHGRSDTYLAFDYLVPLALPALALVSLGLTIVAITRQFTIGHEKWIGRFDTGGAAFAWALAVGSLAAYPVYQLFGAL